MIQEITFNSFGGIKKHSQVVFNPGLNIIYGQNEAGKSTLFNSIHMLFFGIRPTRVDQNPWVPWDSQQIHIESKIKTEDKLFKVTRKLASRPLCQVSDETMSAVENIGNKSLPFIGQISKEKYKHLFHLEMEDLFYIHQKTWDDIEEDLLMRYDEIEINKPSEIIKNLDDELQRIWKDTNRGNNKIKDLEKEKFEHLKDLKNMELEMKREVDLMEELKVKQEDHKALLRSLKSKSVRLEESRLYEPIEEGNSRIARLLEMVNPLNEELEKFKYMDEYQSIDVHEKEMLAIKKEKAYLEKFIKEEREKIEFQLNQTFHTEVPFLYISQTDIDQYEYFRSSNNKGENESNKKDNSKMLYFGLLVAVSLSAVVGIFMDKTPLLWATLLIAFSMIGGLQYKNYKNAKFMKAMDNTKIQKSFAKFFPTVEFESYFLSESFMSRLIIFQKDIQSLYKNVARFNDLKERLEVLRVEMKDRREGFLYLGNNDINQGISIYENHLRMKHELKIEEKRLKEYKEKLIVKDSKWKRLINDHNLGILDKEKLGHEVIQLEKNKEISSQMILELEQAINQLSDGNQYHQKKMAFEKICEEINHLKEKRNELILTKSIIQWTDASFRKKHTPQIVKNASEYLSIMTNGKYSKISIQEENDNKILVVWIDGAYRSPKDNLSQGTQNQIYLAFRLALIDDLNDEKYHMPIVLDEALINFDQVRYHACLDLLEKVSVKRQVFLLTCHPEVINETYKKYMIKI